MKDNFKYIFEGEEVSKERFELLTKDAFKWFSDNSVNAVEFESVSNFFSGDYKSNREINDHFKGILGGHKSEVYTPKEKVGQKYNKLKAPLDILQTRQFPKALQLLALATAYGNHKYKDTDLDFLNFKRVKGGSQTYLDASARHSTNRNNLDIESELHHIIHAVWNQIAALELWTEENTINIEEYSKNYLKSLVNRK